MASSNAKEEFVGLLARVRQGDADALTQLIRLYEPEVQIAARVRLGAARRACRGQVNGVQSVQRNPTNGLDKDKFDLSSPEKLIALTGTLVQRKIARQ
jgi:hypothetical protein